MKESQIDPGIIKTLNKLKSNKGFAPLVLQFRKELGIPESGFSDMRSAAKFFQAKPARMMTVYNYGKRIIKKFKLNESTEGVLQTYLQYGNIVEPTSSMWQQYDGDIAFLDDGIYLKIFPGATARGLKRVIDKEFPRIKAALKYRYPEYTSQTRAKDDAYVDRNKLIFELYNFGVYDKNGKLDYNTQMRYLLGVEGGKYKSITEWFKTKDWSHPDMGQRKNIIEKYKGLQKLEKVN